MPHLFTSLAVLVLVPLAAAFGGPKNPFDATSALALTAPSNEEFAERMLSGDLTGNGQLDAVVLQGDRAWVYHAPALYSAAADSVLATALTASGAVTDIALLGPLGIQGEMRVLTVTDGRLGVHAWDELTASFTFEPLPGGYDDAGVCRIATINPAVSGMTVALALANDRLLYTLLFDPTGIVLSSTMTGELPVGQPRWIEAVQWDPDSSWEVAVAHEDGCTVFDLDGTPSGPAINSASGRAALIRFPGALDRIAWLDDSNSDGRLIVFDWNGTEPSVGIPGRVGAIAAGDADADGLPDLLLDRIDGDDPYWLPASWNQSQGSATFVSDDLMEVTGASSVSGLRVLALADFDHDGDDDLLALEAPGDMLLFESNAIDAESMRPTPDVDVHDLVVLPGIGLQTTVALPGNIPAGATHFELILWEALDHDDGDLTGVGERHRVSIEGLAPGDLASIDSWLVDPTEGGWEYALLELRFVRSVPNEPEVAYPAVVGATLLGLAIPIVCSNCGLGGVGGFSRIVPMPPLPVPPAGV